MPPIYVRQAAKNIKPGYVVRLDPHARFQRVAWTKYKSQTEIIITLEDGVSGTFAELDPITRKL